MRQPAAIHGKASALNDLASKFKTASETGEMPDLRPPGDSGGMRGARGHSWRTASNGTAAIRRRRHDSTSDSSTDTTSGIAQLLSAYQSQSTDPMSVLAGVLKNVLSSTQTSSS